MDWQVRDWQVNNVAIARDRISRLSLSALYTATNLCALGLYGEVPVGVRVSGQLSAPELETDARVEVSEEG